MNTSELKVTMGQLEGESVRWWQHAKARCIKQILGRTHACNTTFVDFLVRVDAFRLYNEHFVEPAWST